MIGNGRGHTSLAALLVPCMAVVLLLVCAPRLSAQDSCAKVLKVVWKESQPRDLRTFAGCYGNEFDIMVLSGWIIASNDSRLDTATFGMLRTVLDSLRLTDDYAWLKEEMEKERQEQKERAAYRPPPLCDPPLYGEYFTSSTNIDIPWYFDLKQALGCALQLDRPVFLFFAAYSDVNSAYIQQNVFTDDSVRSLLAQQFVPVILYIDSKKKLTGGKPLGEENKTLLKERFNDVGTPCLVIISPDDRVITEYHDGMIRTPELLQFLNDGFKHVR